MPSPRRPPDASFSTPEPTNQDFNTWYRCAGRSPRTGLGITGPVTGPKKEDCERRAETGGGAKAAAGGFPTPCVNVFGTRSGQME
ncbi:hypothetical protein NFI96_010331 [Prochilodus magdalenae]|nr:hypothetical protein NFI96_010331 [Prochilodus magdalenae]